MIRLGNRPLPHRLMALKERRGFSLVELLIVIAIFSIVMAVTSSAFKTVLTHTGQQSKSMESEIGGQIGLELLRSDLQDAGYGLPYTFQSATLANYTEIKDDTGMPVSATFWRSGWSPSSFNDAPDKAPRAVLSAYTTFNKDSNIHVNGVEVGSQYLVIKSLLVAPGATQKKWTTVTYSNSGRATTSWGDSARDFSDISGATERVLVMRNSIVDGAPSRQLSVSLPHVFGTDNVFSTTFAQKQYTTLTLPHAKGGSPGEVTDVFQVYGVDPATNPRMPFNRADYYVSAPSNMPPACAPHTGILYKAVAKQATNGGYTEIPLLDCVADMQVVFGLGPVAESYVNNHAPTLDPTPTLIAKDIRDTVKEIRVYILAHEGRKDPSFTYPGDSIDVGEDFGGGLVGRTFDLKNLIGPDWQRYRWKVYTIVARPKNLIQ